MITALERPLSRWLMVSATAAVGALGTLLVVVVLWPDSPCGYPEEMPPGADMCLAVVPRPSFGQYALFMSGGAVLTVSVLVVIWAAWGLVLRRR